MPLPRPPRLTGLLILLALAPLAAGAQPPTRPINTSLPQRYTQSCPLLVPADAPYLQPKRLKPQEVPAKNAAGCLSPSDAVYGPDGCPLKLCPNPTGLNL